MTEIYSHSKLSSFEQCPRKFKFRYIEKIIPEVEKTIESHLGSAVHETLEWLYTKVKEKIIPTLDEIIVKYNQIWEKEFSKEIRIIKPRLTYKDYFNKGVEFLITYYIQNQPFDDNTIEVEKKIVLELGENKEYKIQGFIDRLVYNLKTKEYEIHDYKTANSLPSKEKIEQDRQLALYSIAIKDIYKTKKRVRLVWHFLAHNKKIELKKTDQELEQLKKDIIKLIKKIQNTTHFPAEKSILCDWCEYKSMCPVWGNSPPAPKPKQQKQQSLDNYPTIKKYIKD